MPQKFSLPVLLFFGSFTLFACSIPASVKQEVHSPTPTKDQITATSESASPTQPVQPEQSAKEVIDPSSFEVPAVDTTLHSVPLEEIYFDTFQSTNRAVPLTDANEVLIERLRDAIPPIHNPLYEIAEDASWLHDHDIVLGYASGGKAWAYPVRILNFHEIVNDHLDGIAVLISYCPLCYSGIVFDRQLGEDTLLFGNTSALYQSDMVMLDYQTGSYWWQVAGEAVVGSMTGERLTVLPSSTLTWGAWVELHPDTLVLSRDTGYRRSYESDSFSSYQDYINQGNFAFPVSQEVLDERLEPGVRVLIAMLEEEVHGYSVESEGLKVIMDTLDREPVTVFLDGDAVGGGVFLSKIEGKSLTFEARNGAFFDLQTGSQWNLAGLAIEGALKGAQLTPLPTKTTFWFAAVASEPEIIVISE